jgi:uncharacterized membrane protein YkvA (DUF1232 family)
MKTRAGQLLDRFKSEIQVYRRALVHPRTPRPAKWLLGLAVVYLISPIDLIPDFVPVLGQIDDLVVVSVLVWLALALIPKDVIAECRQYVAGQHTGRNG